ncbi:MAG: glycine zipper 2TM domain-containing protein [Gemmatimonadales bacterium]
MTRTNWIAIAALASVAAAGACSPQGGQAGQPDQPPMEDDRSEAAAENMVSYTVPSGTRLDLTIDDELSSRKNKAGDTFTAKVNGDVRDPAGQVVVESGSTVNGIVVAVKPAPNRRTPGTLTLALSTLEADGQTYPLVAQIDEVQSERRDGPVEGRDAAKVGAGAAAGAVIGQVLSKNTKGTVIGAVFGGLAGAGYAAETRDVDIVLPSGAHILATISEPLMVSHDPEADRSDADADRPRYND